MRAKVEENKKHCVNQKPNSQHQREIMQKEKGKKKKDLERFNALRVYSPMSHKEFASFSLPITVHVSLLCAEWSAKVGPGLADKKNPLSFVRCQYPPLNPQPVPKPNKEIRISSSIQVEMKLK
jgi:hypothetical protein